MQMSLSLFAIPPMETLIPLIILITTLCTFSGSAASILQDATTRNSLALHDLDTLRINVVTEQFSALFSWVFW